jgi:hypothetical protein
VSIPERAGFAELESEVVLFLQRFSLGFFVVISDESYPLEWVGRGVGLFSPDSNFQESLFLSSTLKVQRIRQVSERIELVRFLDGG